MFQRQIFKKLEKYIDSKESIVLTGQRQVGKTTTLNWLLSKVESENKIYIDLERLDQREPFEEKNYDRVLDYLKANGIDITKKIHLAIDEIQIVPNLPSVVKYLYDHYDIKFFLSGSSSYYIKNLFTESMAGRKVVFEMFPLSFGEFLDFKKIKHEQRTILPSQFHEYEYNLLQNQYKEYLQYGGLPKVVLEDDYEKKKILLNEIYSSYINLDVQSIAGFRKIREIRNLVKLLASRVGSKLDVSKLSKILGITRQTVSSYVDFLEMTYLIKRISVYSGSDDIKLANPNKIYFYDNGILNINADLDEGTVFENAVFNQLKFKGDLNYYSKGSKDEVDFIFTSKTAYEVKVTPIEDDLKRLKRISNQLGIEDFYLIGKNKPANYTNFIWAGSIF